jgi:hypothetical protein
MELKDTPIKQDINGYWILNPGAPFELTVMNTSRQIAQEIRTLLDSDDIRYRPDKFTGLFAVYNLKIKEIEEYKNKYKKQYLSKIEELKNNSKEWESSGERDKEDLLNEFREKAIATIYERADCDLITLFEWEHSDITIDDELIKEYGFENIRLYISYSDNLSKIHVAPIGNFLRQKFEKLAELGLAVRGGEIPKEEILSILTLKELNALASNPDKEYKRKNQAIEYILSHDDLEQEIGKFVSLRELFKLKPLPEKYSSLNLDDIAEIWEYHSEEAGLLVRTYHHAHYAWENTDYITGYTVSPANKENPCPCAKDRSLNKYPKNNPPRVPCHIGCNCYFNGVYEGSLLSLKELNKK